MAGCLVLAAFSAASCAEDPPLTPIVDESLIPTVTPPADAGVPYDIKACTTCIATQCVTEHVRCFEQPGCVTILECATTTNCNQACINTCWTKQVGFGRREYQQMTACDFEATCGACNDVCGQSDLCVKRSDDIPDAAPPLEPTTCGDCTKARCNDAVLKCVPGTACDAYFACTNPCLPPVDACVAACGTKNPQGKADADAVNACANNECKAQCVY